MSCFPVRADQLAEAEAALGIALPGAWTQRLLDPRVQRVLAHPRVGALRASDSMARFVGLTMELRERQPQFPRDGVVCFCGVDGRGQFLLDRGYLRFWVPEKNATGRLDDMVHAWDPVKRRRNRDCPTAEFLDGFIASAPDDVLAAEGLARPEQPPLPPLMQWQPLVAAQARLALRDDAARAAVVDEWIIEGTMNVSGTYLTPCDLGHDPSVPGLPAVKVMAGAYAIGLRYAMSARHDYATVAALRLARAGAVVSTRAPLCTLDVDLGAVSVFDRQAFQKQVTTGDRDGACDELRLPPALPCVAIVGRSAQSVHVPSGDGDGSYAVFALHDANGAVGLEIEFVAVNDPRG